MVKESDIQTAIMTMLGGHPLVAWSYVTSTGLFRGYKGGKPINIGIPGLPDICGQLRDGSFLGIEVKKPGQKPSDDQIYFMDLINKNAGLAFWCDSVESAMEGLSRYYDDIDDFEVPPRQAD